MVKGLEGPAYIGLVTTAPAPAAAAGNAPRQQSRSASFTTIRRLLATECKQTAAIA